MKKYFYTLFIIFANLHLYAIEIDDKTSKFSILEKSSLFVDTTNLLSREQLRDDFFVKNTKATLGLGFVAQSSLWIKFTLKNTSPKPIQKVLEYANVVTENIQLYYDDTVIYDGMWNIHPQRESLRPSFVIDLDSYEEKTFYIQAHSKISTLIAKLVLWEKDDFVKHDYKHKTYIFIFFSVIATLLVYNFMLLVFTKDRAYLYYVLYLASVIFFQLNYLGVSQFYLFSSTLSILISKASMIYISFLIMTIVLFTREFLNTAQFKKIDFVLKFYLYITPVIALLSYDNFLFDLNIIAFFIPLGIFTVMSAFYALFHGVKQAKYYVIGWSFVIFSLLLMNLRTIGVFDISKYFSYVNEFAFVLEALLFSIALAHRIKVLTEEKNKADKELIEIQKNEKNRLEEVVNEKTKDLKSALQEKDILYKELNHRVKNNLQMILSLIKLQIGKSKSENTKDELGITKSRINSISSLYESLNLQNKESKADTLAYFTNIIQDIQIGFEKKVKIAYDIRYNLSINQMLYCGLILNELVVNSFKYAFKKEGEIYIGLFKKDALIYFTIEDNGRGFKQEESQSLGLIIVKTLAQKQLFGTLDIDSGKGTKTTIIWEENE